jgi:ubiquinone/menaquinone biosynthesis C-methylase UbiE/uncharacterized protein YbaR (Trm112 family)
MSHHDIYVCPVCKGELELIIDVLRCNRCGNNYPIFEGIPDFITEDISQSASPTLRSVKALDRLATIYESRLWYPLVLHLYGGLKVPSLPELVQWVGGKVHDHVGLLLDVACGPGTYGRRIASEGRTVYGIDISMGMLRRGEAYVKEESNCRMHFARAQVAELPFRKAQFDAAICCGALHLFEDTTEALTEIGRTMKEGATLAVMTFTAGNGGVLRHRWVREHVEADHGAHIFELPELEGYLNQAGFESFAPEVYGSVLVFSARRAAE